MSKLSSVNRILINLFIFQLITLNILNCGASFSLEAQTANSTPRFQWPLIKGELPDLRGITSTFAETRHDHFHNGLDIAGKGDPINSVAAGQYLFSREKSDDPFHPMPGPGNLVLLDHGKGWWSGYYHLESLGVRRSGKVQQASIIGYSGNTGHSSGSHLHFFIIKENGRVYINPLEVLPRVSDKNAPVIGQLSIYTKNNVTLVSHSRQENIRLTKVYPIQITLVDPGLERSSRRGVYKLTWKLNRQAPQMRIFTDLKFSERGWKLNKTNLFNDVYLLDKYTLGKLDFQDGQNTLAVSAEDFSGNKTSRVFTINVKRQF